MCWDSHSEFTHSHLNLRHSPTDPQTSVFTFAVVVVLYFRAGCMALLTAILSDSLPCLICYHDARCYTYTHSAFWSFWLYGKIQTYPLPKRYRLFSLGYPMTKYVVSVIACQTCLSYETDKPPFLYFPVASLVDNASCLSCHAGHFAQIGCKHFACVAVLACTTL